MRQHCSAGRMAMLAAIAMAVVVGGCGDAGSKAAPGELDRVTYLTGFGASAHDAFIFVADELGYFSDAGIDVDIQLAGGTENYRALLADRGDFTYVDFTGMLMNIGNGDFGAGDFRALASVHQSTLIAIVAPESSGITEPGDLAGKRIGAFAGSPTELLLPAYAQLTGWSYDPALLERSDPQGLFGLLASGQVDALSTFVIQRGVIAEAVGEPLIDLPFNEVLPDLLGTGLIATAALAERDPELVERFRDAALAGLRQAVADPPGAVEILRSREPGAVADPAPLIEQIEIMTPYVTARGEERVGVLDAAQVAACIQVLSENGLIPAGLTPDVLIGDTTLLP